MARFKTYGSINGVEGSVLNTPFVPGTSQLNLGPSATPTSRYNTDGNSIGSSSFSSRGNNVSDIGLTVAQKVMSSVPYKQAFELFSKLSDKTWLQRLQAIPYSVDDANSTFLDSLGATNNFEDKQDANYQYCMEQISALLAEYQSWSNSLPITQAQQFADAGINSAITGQGINSSSIPNVGVSTDPSSLQSTNVGEHLSNLVGKLLDVSSGTLDWISKFNEIGLAKERLAFDKHIALERLDFDKNLGLGRLEFDKDSAFAEFASVLSKDGVILPEHIKSFDDLIKSDDNSWYDSASARARRLYNQFTEIRNMDSYGTTVVSRTLDGDYRTGDVYSYDSNGKLKTRFGSIKGASVDMNSYTKNIADLQYSLWLNDLKYRAEYSKAKKEWHDKNGYTTSEDIQLLQSENLRLDKVTKEYENERLKIVVDYIKKLKTEADAGNVSSRIQLMDALYELNNTSMFADLIDEVWSSFKNLF